MSGRRAGFTLIELLIVIAIIAVLAAMLMPVYVNAKRCASRTVCQSNLAQIARGFASYVTDYDGCYPCVSDQMLWTGRHWRWPVRRYVCFYGAYNPSDPNGRNQITKITSSVLACPSDPTPGSVYDRTSYGYSASFFHTSEQINAMTTAQLYTPPGLPCVAVKQSMVVNSTKKAMIADWATTHSGTKFTWWKWDGERNYLFADGHIRYLAAKKIHPAVSPNPSVTRTSDPLYPSIVGTPDINLTTDGVAGQDID